MPGRHVTYHQMRLFMQFRQSDSAAKAAFSPATGHRISADPRLPSVKKAPRTRRRPDPLAEVFETEIAPLLEAAPGLRPVAVFGEILRHHPDLGERGGRPLSGASGLGAPCTGPIRTSSSVRPTSPAE